MSQRQATTRPPVSLDTLIDGLRLGTVQGRRDVMVTGVAADSRQVRPGALFCAIRGLGVDGHDYIHSALRNGAVAILAEQAAPVNLDAGVTWIRVPDTETAAGRLVSRFFGDPSVHMPVLAVTGTNGKSTATWLLAGLLRHLGFEPGLLGTITLRIGREQRETIWTTPPAIHLQPQLAEMREAGCTHAVIEASSHGLAMKRMAGTRVAVGGFTNLSRDHLDFHETMEAYRDAKELLFTEYADSACFNIDDEVGAAFAAAYDKPKLTVSVAGAAADIRVVGVDNRGLDGARISLETPAGALTAELPLLGRHNVENAVVALGMAHLAGVALADAADALGHTDAPPGRLERVTGPRAVFVDYAHTPDALRAAFGAVADVTRGRLIGVFGAGGDRDPGKRPEMGAVVAELADLVIVTSDNPRSEEPEAIIDAVVAGTDSVAGAEVTREVDRAKAIHAALALAGVDDVVLIAGKGHETYQIIGDTKRDFDDRLVARQAMQQLFGGAA